MRSKTMGEGLSGQVALFTGPATPLAVTVARRLGNAGVRLAFAGPRAGRQSELRPLLCQFRRDIVCLDADLTTAEAAQDVVAQVEGLFGQVDLFIHTLGNASVDCFEMPHPAAAALALSSGGPLVNALICSSGAIRHMASRHHGHVLHLVARSAVGAMEVEKLVLSRLQEAWTRDGAPGNVALSTIYFEELAPLMLTGDSEPAGASEPRLLESFTAGLLAEDDWMSRVALEREIGSLVMRVCSRPEFAAGGAVHTFDFPAARELAG